MNTTNTDYLSANEQDSVVDTRSSAAPPFAQDTASHIAHTTAPNSAPHIAHDPQSLRGALEALLFVSDEPVTSARLAKVLDKDLIEVDEALAQLAQDYREENRGFQLREVAGGWRMYTHPAFAPIIEAYVLSWDTRKLSQAALEVLSVIAYKQPVTRAGINAVRGVSSESVVSSLIEKGLARELGRDTRAGNAILYGTTATFLTKFGLKSIEDLPPLEDFAPDAQTQASIKRRLGVVDESMGDEMPAELDAEAIVAELDQTSTTIAGETTRLQEEDITFVD